MRATDLLANNGYILVNKAIAKELGLNEAIMLGELAQEYNYWDDNDKLDDGWFYSTIENVESNTTLSAYQQRNALKKLEEYGIVEVQQRGVPCKRYILLRVKKLNFKMLNNLTTGSEKISQQEIKKLNGNNNNKNNNNNNKPKYKRPTLEEVNQYINEKGLSVDGNKFFTYFEEGNWIDSRGNPVRNWKQKLLTWENKNDRRANSNHTGKQNSSSRDSRSSTSYDRRNRNRDSDIEGIREYAEAIAKNAENPIDYSSL